MTPVFPPVSGAGLRRVMGPAVLLVVALSGVLGGCSWFGGKDKTYNELQPLTAQVEVRQRWKKSVGSGSGDLYRLLAPVIVGDVVYANDHKGRVYAFDRDSGKRLWRQPLQLNLASGPGVGGGLVLVASVNGYVVAMDDQTGEVQWKVNIASEILAPPQNNGSIVVVQTNNGKLYGLDATSGLIQWSYTTQPTALSLRGTAVPQVLGANIVTGFASGKLVALSAVDGSPYWERRIARPRGRSDIERVVDIDGTPTISDNRIYATSYNGTLSALSPRGQLLWSQANSSYSSPVVFGNRVFVTTAAGAVKAFRADTGQLLWENAVLSGRQLAAPQNLAGFLVTADFEGYVHVFDSEAGMLLDRFKIDKHGVRAPMVSDGTYLYVLGNDGKLAAIAVYLING